MARVMCVNALGHFCSGNDPGRGFSASPLLLFECLWHVWGGSPLAYVFRGLLTRLPEKGDAVREPLGFSIKQTFVAFGGPESGHQADYPLFSA